jgi:hypothetical protein
MLSPAKVPLISSHADYHHSDYVFERTMSRAMNQLEWEHREAPLRSWSQMLLPAASLLAAAAVAVEILH